MFYWNSNWTKNSKTVLRFLTFLTVPQKKFPESSKSIVFQFFQYLNKRKTKKHVKLNKNRLSSRFSLFSFLHLQISQECKSGADQSEGFFRVFWLQSWLVGCPAWIVCVTDWILKEWVHIVWIIRFLVCKTTQFVVMRKKRQEIAEKLKFWLKFICNWFSKILLSCYEPQ